MALFTYGFPQRIVHRCLSVSCKLKKTMPYDRIQDSYPVFGNWPQIILFGDSLTQFSFGYNGFWGAAVADQLQRKVDILNRGFSGYNSRNGRSLLPLLFNSTNVDRIVAFVICLGANDACDPVLNPTQGLMIDEYVNNLTAMVNYLETIGVGQDKIIFITPPPLDEQAWEANCKKTKSVNSKSSHLTTEFAKAAAVTMSRLGVEVVDMHFLMLHQENWRQFLIDGLHLTHQGAVFWSHQLMPLLHKRTKDLPVVGPYWQLFNPDDPLSSTIISKI